MTSIRRDPPPDRLGMHLEAIDPEPGGSLDDVRREVLRLTSALRELIEERSLEGSSWPMIEQLREVLASLVLTPLNEGAQRASLRSACEALARMREEAAAEGSAATSGKRRRAAWRKGSGLGEGPDG